jgi:glycosyltransferase involved in cell wall biosynthesis
MNQDNISVTILGSMPPLRALSSYCLSFYQAISGHTFTEFISFKSIYPSFLYPGGELREDNTFPPLKENLKARVRRNLTWYNPLSWIIEGVQAKGQILHAQWWSPPLLIIYLTICIMFKIRKRPVVFTVHNILSHEKNPFYELCSRILFKFCDHFIVHSKANRASLIEHFNINEESISQIPHGPLAFNSGKEMSREDARKRLGICMEAKVILFFGAIRPYKGLDIALEAFAMVIKEVPDARLLIAGRLWETWDKYQKIIDENGLSKHVDTHLHYINTDEVAAFFNASDLVILPYLEFDSQSGVGAAAMAFNKPMIVSDTGGLPELVNDQKNIIPPGDVESLAARIIYCLKNRTELEKMSIEAKKIAARMSWGNIAIETFKVYEKFINEKNSN